MVASIKEFGFRIPILAKRDGTIVDGHLRVKAAKQLGMTELPVIYADGMTDAQIQAFRLLVNRSVQWAAWDEELLKIELLDLKQNDFDLRLTGFDDEELGRFLIEDKTEVGEGVEDTEETLSKADELQQKWQVSEGEIWVCGDHRILCGDCQDRGLVERLLDKTVDLMLTDPPYGIKRDQGFGGAGGFAGKGKPIQRRQYTDEWDSERPSAETFAMLLELATESIIFGGNFFADLLPMSTHWLVWDKHQTMPTFGDCELAWTSIGRKSVKKYDLEFNGLIGKEGERFHPTQKPIKLFSQIIDDYTDVGAVVFDPYSGSGTTLLAAEQTGRIARVVERMPGYVAVALERWSALMNQTPVKL